VKLLLRFNLVLILIFGCGISLISRYAYNFLMDNARQQVLQQAQLITASVSATKDYTDDQVSNLLVKNAQADDQASPTPEKASPAGDQTTPAPEKTPQDSSDFLPQTIPFYAANATFKYLRKSYPDYLLREAALNPTNLEDRATEWEVDLINYFRDNPSEAQQVGVRNTPIGPMLYVATPVVAAQGCLQCHSDASIAPAAMIRHYGADHGLGWRANDVVGAQIVSVPMAVPIAMADKGFHELLIGLGAIFLLTIFLIDLSMYVIVIRPLRRVSRNADRISKGELDLPPLKITGKDEIAEVTASFNRMHTSLIKAFEMLNG
jgi:HAMP domain-containing protein